MSGSSSKKRRECGVCAESRTVTQITSCPACEFESCKECLKTYILGVGDDGACMHCKHKMPRSVLADLLGITFVNGEYKRHLERVLFDRERAMLEETTPYLQRESTLRETTKHLHSLRQHRVELQAQLRQIDVDIQTATRQTYRLMNLQTRGAPLNETEAGDEARREFVHACPREGCEGFVSSAWKCRACNHYICKDCNIDKGDERTVGQHHECSKDDVESLRLIRSDSKPCPKCAVPIHKVSGCPQMYCTMCACVWSWKTGRIDTTGRVHNPHALGARLAMGLRPGRDPADIPCGGMPDARELYTALVKYCTLKGFKCVKQMGDMKFWQSIMTPQEEYATFRSLHHRMTKLSNMVTHVSMYEMPRYEHREPEDIANVNRDLRIKYLLSEVTREAVGRKVYEREKRLAKDMEVVLIFRTFVQSSQDLLRQIAVNPVNLATLLDQCDLLVDYCNISMCKLSYLFSCIVPVLTGAGSYHTLLEHIHGSTRSWRWTKAGTPTIHDIFGTKS